jgi:hypothetical protein
MSRIVGYITMSAYLTKRHRATIHKYEDCLLMRWSEVVPVTKLDEESSNMKKCKVCWKEKT